MRNNSGFALMAVLFITSLVSTLALGYATTARLKALQVRHGHEKVQEAFRLASCLELGWHEYQKYRTNQALLNNREEVEAITGHPLELWHPRFEPYLAQLDGNLYEIQLLNENGRFNINTISLDDLLQVLKFCGADEMEALAVADAILDFVDSDENHRLNGAENDYYQSLEFPYTCKNQPFENIEELLLVRGVTSALYNGSDGRAGLADMLSVLGASTALDVNSASPLLFEFIEELPAEMAQAVAQLRQEKPISNMAELSETISYEFFDAFKKRFSVLPATYLTITATRKLDKGRKGGRLSVTHSFKMDQQS